MASTSSATGDTQKSSEVKMEIDSPVKEAAASSSVASAPGSSTPEPVTRTVGMTLADLANQLEEYPPTMPDPIVTYYMHSAGFEATDSRIVRLISLATQKFVADIANDALVHYKMRGAGQSSKKAAKDKRNVLTMDDLTPALSEYGIKVKKPHYFP